jgi:hypothetical protein
MSNPANVKKRQSCEYERVYTTFQSYSLFTNPSFKKNQNFFFKTPRDWSRITQLELQLPMIPVGQRLHVNG